MKIDQIKELIEILNHTDIAELCVESEGVKISIKKGAAFVPPPQPVQPPAAPAAPAPAEAPAPQPPAAEAEKADAGRYVTVTAPMVGTFYRAPAPDAAPYVSVGDVVHVGQPLCIIEAMKLMNEIESEVEGRIVEILVENEEPVEYGQPLFLIEPL
ncbi:MAG: acetyl-CoA carboxylase biotin carboxyl carrier protein [Clostridia bacterium]|nr:acetyl-CoA carboxylase biotin carboxyl carrier protein [Bacillota bacterium]MBO2520688.1 acetyl-CoA carboxylase biotin carboxyl carrier protein [Bacillota bacterium]